VTDDRRKLALHLLDRRGVGRIDPAALADALWNAAAAVTEEPCSNGPLYPDLAELECSCTIH
jgi:hypothetical protein